MNNKTKYCIFCSQVLHSAARFCSSCGKRQPGDAIESPEEKIELLEEEPSVSTALVANDAASFDAIGAATLEDDDIVPEPPKKERKPRNEKRIKWFAAVARTSLVLALSIVMLVMAFMPILEIEYGNYLEDLEFNVSAIDNIVFLTDSFYSLEEDEILDGALSEELEELEEELQRLEIAFEDDYDDLSHSAKRLINKYIRLAMRASWRSAEVYAPSTLIAAALLSLLYILVSVALLVVSALHLLTLLRLLPISAKKLWSTIICLLCASPVLLLVLYYAMHATYTRNIFDASMAEGVVTSLIMAGIGVLALTLASIFIFKRKEKINIVPRLIAIAMSLVTMLLVFAPVMTSSIYTVFEGKTTKREMDIAIDASFFTNMNLTETEREDYDDFFDSTFLDKSSTLENKFDNFSVYTVGEIRDGDANSVNNDLIMQLVASKKLHVAAVLYAQIPFLYLLIVIFSGFILWQSLSYLAGGKYFETIAIIGKILSMIFALTALALVIVFLVFVCEYIETYGPVGYELSINAGIICLTVFAILQMFCPTGTRKTVKKALAPRTPRLYELADDDQY